VYSEPLLQHLNTPFQIGSLRLPNRLIQGPLAGFSCSPFRALFSSYGLPGYCVSEMLSAIDVLEKHKANGRYLHRSAVEGNLCYQIAGEDPEIIANAAKKLENLGANLIDINCGCPKPKIIKKGYGSALLTQPQKLIAIVNAVREKINCPLTIKIRLQAEEHQDVDLINKLENAGVDAVIIHARTPQNDYRVPCNLQRLTAIKKVINIPIIANGDITDLSSLEKVVGITQCDGYMISRASTGKPWLYKEILSGQQHKADPQEKIALFSNHLAGLAELEGEFKAVLQSRKLFKYYFPALFKDPVFQKSYYTFTNLREIFESLLHKDIGEFAN
jgi:tRNA-dihydrouridine synthase B